MSVLRKQYRGIRQSRLALLVTSAVVISLIDHGQLATAGAPATPAAPTVEANHEQLSGAYGIRYPGVASFKGIPFSAAPVGKLRWQAPQPHQPRAGAQNARDFAAACFQDRYNSDWYRRVAKAFGLDELPFSDPPFSEDCLYLNVWTPALAAGAGLPVMVWIHGGSNKAGWTFEPNYLGENLAARGRVVVASIAYRLGVFGFFGHPELRGSAAPTNFGLLDQVAALRWVHDHIRSFGGDPGNVTLFGESAGAAGIGYLITSPLARGLFQRVISESGGFLMQDKASLADAQQVGVELAQALPGHPDLAGLRARSSAEIFHAAKVALPDQDWRPVVDGISLQMSPAAFYRRHGLPYDLLIGSNENEYYMYVDADPASFARALAKFPPAARELLAQRAAQELDIRRGHDRVTALAGMGCPPYLMAASARGSGHHSWVYRFTRVRPGPGGEQLLAYHGAEIPYVFDTHDSWLSGDALDVELSTSMVAYWSNFSRSGDPNGAGLVPWPAFAAVNSQVLQLGARIAPIAAPDQTLCERIAGDIYPGWSH